eukprot:3928889-Alexandrium_andersonii.AAC.1
MQPAAFCSFRCFLQLCALSVALSQRLRAPKGAQSCTKPPKAADRRVRRSTRDLSGGTWVGKATVLTDPAANTGPVANQQLDEAARGTWVGKATVLTDPAANTGPGANGQLEEAAVEASPRGRT